MSVTRSAVIRLFSARLNSIERFFAHRAAIAHLHALDDEALCDIGLARSNITAAVHGSMNSTASPAALYAANDPRAGGREPAARGEATPWN